MHVRPFIAASLLTVILLSPPVLASEDPQAAAAPAPAATTSTAAAPVVPSPFAAAAAPAATLEALTRENALLQEKLKALESCSITTTELAHRNTKRLKEIAQDVRAQRQGLAEFEGHVKWMSGHVAGYNKYLAAGSMAARFAKILPIPYAGQASLFTKFVSDAAASLGTTSVSITKYLGTSQQFLTRVDAVDPAKPNDGEVSELVRLADQDLLKGMLEVQDRLVATSHLTTSTLSFLESLNHYVGSTDEYWSKTKSLLSSGDDKNEKSFLSESTTNLRNKAQTFNAKFVLFDATVKKTAPQIKSLVAYDDLIRSIDPKLAKLK